MSSYYVSSGVTSTGVILNEDYMTVLDGGVAIETTANEYGVLYVWSGGTANSTTVNAGGYICMHRRSSIRSSIRISECCSQAVTPLSAVWTAMTVSRFWELRLMMQSEKLSTRLPSTTAWDIRAE